MSAAEFLVIRYQALALANAAHGAWANHRRDLIAVTAGGGFLAAHEIDVIRIEIAARGAFFAAHAGEMAICCGAIAAASGVVSSRYAGQTAHAMLSQPWLAVQPWTVAARASAIRWGTVLPGMAHGAVVAACSGLLFSWARLPVCCGVAALSALIFAIGFLAALRWSPTRGATHRHPRGDRPATTSRSQWPAAFRLTAKFDSIRPAWCATWTLEKLDRSRMMAWLAGATAMTAVSSAIAMAQSWPFAAVCGAWLAAHLIFLDAAYAGPLTSAILRTAPLGYMPVAAGVLRGPLTISLAAYAGCATVAWAVAGAPIGLIATSDGLLLLTNGIAFAVITGLPQTRGLALIVYGSAVLLTLYEKLEYGDGIYLCLAAFTVFLVWQGRKAYRGH